jgi:hypothetical protein
MRSRFLFVVAAVFGLIIASGAFAASANAKGPGDIGAPGQVVAKTAIPTYGAPMAGPNSSVPWNVAPGTPNTLGQAVVNAANLKH